MWDYGYTPWPFQLPFSLNIWDDGTEGNYWSNYNGTDSNGDGVGDTPHDLYENNTDNHPLIEPVTIEVIPEFPDTTPHTSEPFPTTWIAATIIIVTIAVFGVAILVYLKRIKKNRESSGLHP